jgi:hypothetical protein
LLRIVPEDHPLAGRQSVMPAEIASYPLIGIDPNDPYGRIMASIFTEHSLSCEMTIRAPFGSTVCAPVTARRKTMAEVNSAKGGWRPPAKEKRPKDNIMLRQQHMLVIELLKACW